MLLEFWANPIWLAYCLGCVGAGVALQGTHKAYSAALEQGQRLQYTEYVLPITYATFSALFGTFSVVLAKILSELLTLQIEFGVNVSSQVPVSL